MSTWILPAIVAAAMALAATVAPEQSPAPSLRAAVERSLPLLQSASIEFLQTSHCVSCHHNTLTVLTLAMARSQNIRVDEDLAFEQQERTSEYVKQWPNSAASTGPDDLRTVTSMLLSMSADGYPSDESTDRMAGILLRQQMQSGEWRPAATHSAASSDAIAVAAAAIRVLQVYGPKNNREAAEAAIGRAAAWLEHAQPSDTAGRAYRLLGLDWARSSKDRIGEAARTLIALQQADGGWARDGGGESEAYATGQALFALLETKSISATDTPFERGATFLLRAQSAEGSWRGVYPVGSIAPTNWAAFSLALGFR
jgi:hypothetical protein